EKPAPEAAGVSSRPGGGPAPGWGHPAGIVVRIPRTRPPARGVGGVIIVSGVSGSGGRTAPRCFAGMGFFCAGNLPRALIPVFADLCVKTDTIQRAALVVDVREGAFLSHFPEVLMKLRQGEPRVTLLFFDAADEVLIRRFSESRRPHPLAQDRPLE